MPYVGNSGEPIFLPASLPPVSANHQTHFFCYRRTTAWMIKYSFPCSFVVLLYIVMLFSVYEYVSASACSDVGVT